MTRQTNLEKDDLLEDFECRNVRIQDLEKKVYLSGKGPAVVVMAEMPGISPHVARFARWVREAGFTVYMPSLFGRDGAVPEVSDGVEIFKRTCISREFRAFAGGEASPVTDWLRRLAKVAHIECGGPGVGAIGMCFTGNFALSMMMEPAVIAPVLAQPSLPLDNHAAIESSQDELAEVRKRLEQNDLVVHGYRFAGDLICRAERFAAYADALGDRFISHTLPDSAANSDVSPFFQKHVAYPHSVVTQHLINEAGQPTLKARDQILSFFTERLKP